ncbi:LPS assembly lipoprotein LptE [Tranquillimonas alkanivorans]|uniref:LPS-assembly lipoprotein n=1 Tax=Tranquillimonas alkanivorans TaxID=441119 RepID=A0A1I5W7F5_9RHOB|nr:LPS assembly lipoprotein LptE [Tranquillimonas alkanivorans]SFQ15694.1 LPS-assembly lipoprotein [Tranquillimonas alkanivorans]
MSSFDRRAALLSLAALAACGFTPVYGPGGAAEGLRGTIAVDPPDDPEGYALVRQLERRLGQPVDPLYDLSADILLRQEGLGVTPDQEVTRYQLIGAVRFVLTEIASGEAVATGEVRNFTGYSAPVFDPSRGSIAGNPVTVLTAERDARERLMTILADQVVAQLLATAPEWRR